jgi:8-oxo-dGTP diphosphatase
MSKIQEYLKTKPALLRSVVSYPLKNDEVILGIRKQSSLGLGLNLIVGIGGKVGDIPGLENETYEEALVREVEEEIGLKIEKFEKVGEITFLFPYKPKWNMLTVAYIVTKWKGELTETESIKPETYPINNLPSAQMWEDNQYWVPLLLGGKKVKAVFMYGDDNKSVVEQQIEIVEEI